MSAVQIMNQMRGEMRYDEPLSYHTSWRVGGPARRFYRPQDSEDLVQFLQGLPVNEPILWLGLGSNLLVRDAGFNGTVIALKGRIERMEMVSETCLRAEAGASCARVARLGAREGLVGLEFLAGIPGTMGGALAMNAGAFGGETWKSVTAVETVDRWGQVRRRRPDEFRIGYRQVQGTSGEWFLAAYLEAEPGDVQAGQRRIRQLLELRAASQPIGLPSCGSVFRNPKGKHAARLIEAAGMKGVRIGGAQVSEKHANFIINTGGATAADIEQLIERVQQRVEQESGIRLETEVHMIGEAEPER